MNFKPLSVDDYDIIKPFFSEQPYSLSIYSPSSLIAWSNSIFSSSYAIIDGILFISGNAKDSPAGGHLIMPVSPNRLFTPHELSDYAREFGFDKYWYAPEDYLTIVDNSELDEYFTKVDQKEFEDYVYLTDDLILLKGNKYSKKRNLISQFTREYIRKGRVTIETIKHRDNVDECLDFLEIWCKQHDCDEEQESSLACEKSALIITLKHMDHLETIGILVRIDGLVSAFGIGSHLNRTTAVLNYEKAFSEIKGLYQFLDNECAKRLFPNFKYINKESDMNLPNLAESKLSYNPVHRIKSYALILR